MPTPNKAEVDGRSIATTVVERVLADAAYASRALDAELGRYPRLDSRERALAAELAYGTLRSERFLLDHLERHTKRGLKRKDHYTMAHLLVAAYQLLLLDRVPSFAAVDCAVAAIRQRRGPKVAGFCNAVLRRLSSEEPGVSRGDAAWLSAPEWLRARLESELGRDEARAMLGADGSPPSLAVRLAMNSSLPPDLSLVPCRLAPRAYRVSTGELLLLREANLQFVIQEEGAQLIAHALAARPGERILDACSGRGGKTSLLWETMGSRGTLFACDAYPDKLAELARHFRMLGHEPPRSEAVDWTKGTGTIPGDFDRVLVDAPCTGTGTVRRRPEILRRIGEHDPGRMGKLQAAILRRAATRLRPGGRLVYAVCSVLEQETARVVEAVSDVLRPIPFEGGLPQGLVEAGQSTLTLSPARHGTDGYFLASLALV